MHLHQQPGDVVVDGKRLETLWINPQETRRPTIVMLHEGLGSVALWKDFPQKLAARSDCRVFVYSRYGHGSSDKLMEKRPVEFMHHEGEVVLQELLRPARHRAAILLGRQRRWLYLAHLRREICERPARALILEAPHVFVEDLSVSSITQAKVNYQTTDLPRRVAERHHAQPDATFWGWNDIWLDPHFRSWNIEAYLPAIRCPILCIQGEEDEYGTIAQVQAIQARVLGTEIVMLPNCKHSPHRDQPEATLERVAQFVAEVQEEVDSKQGLSFKETG